MFVPASDFIGVQLDKPNFAKLRTLVNVENKLLGQVGNYQQPLAGTATSAAPEASDIAWLVVLAYAATLLAGAAVAVLCIRRKTLVHTSGHAGLPRVHRRIRHAVVEHVRAR